MSECVVRMEMPQNCETCPLRVNNSPTNVPDWICGINQWPTFYCKKSQNHANEDKYLYDCPIVCQLPEGHGRLVDADELRREMYHEAFETDTNMQKWDSGCWIRYKMFENTIGAVPTIVQAEAERSET